jgi:hypothetical protein
MLDIVQKFMRECVAIKVARKLNSMCQTLATFCCLAGCQRIDRGSRWENGHLAEIQSAAAR